MLCEKSGFCHFSRRHCQGRSFHNSHVFADDRRIDGKKSPSVYTSPVEQSKVVDLRSFVQDGWLKLGLRVSLPTKPHSKNELVPSRSRVEIEVLEETHIREHVETKASTDVFAIPRRCLYVCPPNKPLNDVKNMVRSNPFAAESKQSMDGDRLKERQKTLI